MPETPADAAWVNNERRGDVCIFESNEFVLRGDEERHLRTWDFVHCPPGTGHTFVGAGDARA